MKKKKISRAFCTLGFSLLSLSAFAQTSPTELGIEQYRAAQYDDAVETLRPAAVGDSTDRLAWLYYGAALAKTQKPKEAVDAFRKAGNGKLEIRGDDSQVTFKRKTHPRYNALARSNRTSGTVRLAVEFKADSTVEIIAILDRLRDGLTESAISAAKSIGFEPAKRGGKPVSVVKVVEYSFRVY